MKKRVFTTVAKQWPDIEYLPGEFDAFWGLTTRDARLVCHYCGEATAVADIEVEWANGTYYLSLPCAHMPFWTSSLEGQEPGEQGV